MCLRYKITKNFWPFSLVKYMFDHLIPIEDLNILHTFFFMVF